MAFTSSLTRTEHNHVGDRQITTGTYVNTAGSIGGDIDTGLSECEYIQLQPTGAAVGANQPSVNETLPVDGSAVTVVTDADQDGIWIAYGR